MKNIRIFIFHFLVVKFSIYLNRHVFVMTNGEPYCVLSENVDTVVNNLWTNWNAVTSVSNGYCNK